MFCEYIYSTYACMKSEAAANIISLQANKTWNVGAFGALKWALNVISEGNTHVHKH